MGRNIHDFWLKNLDWPLVETAILRRFSACAAGKVLPRGAPRCGWSGATLWRVATARGNLCLRAHPGQFRDVARLAWIHRTLEEISRQGCELVPLPLRTQDHRTWVDWEGRLWELSTWLPGEPSPGDDPTASRVESAMAAIARFHRIAQLTGGYQEGIAPAVEQRLDFLARLERGLLERIVRAAMNPSRMENSPLAELAAAIGDALERIPWLLSQAYQWLAPFAERPVPLQVCHGDLWHDNVLWEGDRVSGLIDCALMRIDTPASDLARFLGSVSGTRASNRRAGLEAYSRICPLNDAQRELVAVLDFSSPPLAFLNWLGWILLENRQFPDWSAVRTRVEGLTAGVKERHAWVERRFLST